MSIGRHVVLVSCVVLVAATGCGERGVGSAACEEGTEVCIDHGEVEVDPGAAPPDSASAAEAPCPPPAGGNSEIDWVPFVVVDGQMYVRGDADMEQALEEDRVGEVVGTVSCRIAEVGDPGFEPRDGDAAYLPAGTELHQVMGRPPGEALAAFEDGAWQLFEPATP